jgi:FXSXX-COOH protein
MTDEPAAEAPDVSDLPDLSFAELRRRHPVLAEVIERLKVQMEEPQDAVAGFQSSI